MSNSVEESSRSESSLLRRLALSTLFVAALVGGIYLLDWRLDGTRWDMDGVNPVVILAIGFGAYFTAIFERVFSNRWARYGALLVIGMAVYFLYLIFLA